MRRLFVFLFSALAAAICSAQDLAQKSAEAKQAMTSGNYDRAIVLYREMVRELPSEIGLRLNLGLALHSAGQYQEAVQQFTQVLRSDPTNKPALFFEGADLLRAGQPRRAVDDLVKLLQYEPGNQNAIAQLGNAYMALGDYEKAYKEFGHLCASAPENLNACTKAGLAASALARREFEWLDQHAAFSGEWYALAGNSALDRQLYDRAFYFYRQALSKSPDLPGVHAGLAEVYRKTGHPDWASVEKSRDHTAAPPAASETDRHYKRALQYQQRASEAMARVANSPESAQDHELLGFAYRLEQRDEDSLKQFRLALEADPQNRMLQREVATSLLLSGKYEDAKTILLKLRTEDPNSPEVNQLLGECLVNTRSPAQAVPYLKQALTRDPAFLPAHASLGRAYLHMGQYQLATEELKKALPLEDAQLYFQLAEACRKVGKTQEADTYLAEYKRRSTLKNELNEAVLRSEIQAP